MAKPLCISREEKTEASHLLVSKMHVTAQSGNSTQDLFYFVTPIFKTWDAELEIQESKLCTFGEKVSLKDPLGKAFGPSCKL